MLHSILRCKVIGKFYSSKVATAYTRLRRVLWAHSSCPLTSEFLPVLASCTVRLDSSRSFSSPRRVPVLPPSGNCDQLQMPNSDPFCCSLYAVREESTYVPIITRKSLYKYSWLEIPESILSPSDCACGYRAVWFSSHSSRVFTSLHVSSTVYSTWVSGQQDLQCRCLQVKIMGLISSYPSKQNKRWTVQIIGSQTYESMFYRVLRFCWIQHYPISLKI